MLKRIELNKNERLCNFIVRLTTKSCILNPFSYHDHRMKCMRRTFLCLIFYVLQRTAKHEKLFLAAKL